jgi:hypothetical protein
MANWRKASTPNVWVAHQNRCTAFADASARCNCTPSWRGRRWNPFKRDSESQKPVTKDRNEVLSWLGAGKKGAAHLRDRASAGRTFESIGDEWIAGVAAGRIGRRKGRGKPYTEGALSAGVLPFRLAVWCERWWDVRRDHPATGVKPSNVEWRPIRLAARPQRFAAAATWCLASVSQPGLGQTQGATERCGRR